MSELGMGMDDIDLLRPLYFMLDDAESMANDSGLSAIWWEAQMLRLMGAGLVHRRALSGTEGGPWASLVWELTAAGAELVEAELRCEEFGAAS